jgi:putative PIN family toxin of toxin-antitoxin system
MLRAFVIDTCVIAAALRSRLGASNALLRLAQYRRYRLLASPPLFLEYEAVLLRPEQRLAHRLIPTEVEEFLKSLAALVEPVDIHFKWRPQLADAGDEMVLEAAINGRADALVTHNVRDFSSAAARFQLKVLTPQQALFEVQ